MDFWHIVHAYVLHVGLFSDVVIRASLPRCSELDVLNWVSKFISSKKKPTRLLEFVIIRLGARVMKKKFQDFWKSGRGLLRDQ